MKLVKLFGAAFSTHSDHNYPIVGHKKIGYVYNIIMNSQNLDDITNLIDTLFQKIDIYGVPVPMHL